MRFKNVEEKQLNKKQTESPSKLKIIPLGGLEQIGLNFTRPQGAYYVLMDISEFGYEDDEQFCIDLAKKVGVAAVPGSSFFKEDVRHLVRFHFAKQDETLQKALERLSDIHTAIQR